MFGKYRFKRARSHRQQCALDFFAWYIGCCVWLIVVDCLVMLLAPIFWTNIQGAAHHTPSPPPPPPSPPAAAGAVGAIAPHVASPTPPPPKAPTVADALKSIINPQYLPAVTVGKQPTIHGAISVAADEWWDSTEWGHLLHRLQGAWNRIRGDPWALLPELWAGLEALGGWVVWNYEDLYHQLRDWDGTGWGLASHLLAILWRGGVVISLTYGLAEAVPWLYRTAVWMWHLLRGVWPYADQLMDDVWAALTALWRRI